MTPARLLLGVAAAQFVFAVPSWVIFEARLSVGESTVVWVPFIAISFLATSFSLLWAGRTDKRALYLSGVFAGVVGAFAMEPAYASIPALGSPWYQVADFTLSLRVEAFLPFCLWSFAARFPRGVTRWDPWVTKAGHASLALGLVLIVANIADAVRSLVGTPLNGLLRYGDQDTYWALILTAALPALLVMPVRATRAAPAERRRVRLLLAGVVVGGTPIVVFALLDAFGLMKNAELSALSAWIVYPALASVPLTTAYAVVVHRALNVRLVVRAALQYALARYTLIATGLAPLVGLGAFLFANRTRAVSELFVGPRAGALIGLSLASLVLLRGREWLLAHVDRRFFRDQYDARKTLQASVRECREAGSIEELERVLVRRVEQAFHPRSTQMLRRRPGDAWFTSRRDRADALAPGGALVSTLARSRQVMTSREVARVADTTEQAWLSRREAELMVPLQGSHRDLLGILVLGPKRSELPYTAEDRALLGLVAEAASLRIDGLTTHSVVDVEASEGRVWECTACGAVQPAAEGEDRCRICLGTTVPGHLPLALAGRFAMVRRLGAGGEGRAYLAEDLRLGRRVALKMLRGPGGEGALHLAWESRALASVDHPNVASVYSIEEHGGHTVLVLEYLPGGTLAQRLESGPIPRAQLADLVDQLGAGLMHLHERGILHRDVKPSNVGFTEAGTAKLLDFGQVKTAAVAGDTEAGTGGVAHDTGVSGTVAYMSPDALAGAPPCRGDDLWALSVVTWECATGQHPFRGRTTASTMARILTGGPPDLTRWTRHDCRAVADCLVRALSRDAEERFATVAGFQAAIRTALA